MRRPGLKIRALLRIVGRSIIGREKGFDRLVANLLELIGCGHGSRTQTTESAFHFVPVMSDWIASVQTVRAMGRILSTSVSLMPGKMIHQCHLEHRPYLLVGVNVVLGQVLDGVYNLLPNVFVWLVPINVDQQLQRSYYVGVAQTLKSPRRASLLHRP